MHRPPNHLRSTSATSATPKLQLPHTNPSNPSPPQSRTTHNAPPLLPNRRPHGRFVRHAGRVWRPRPQEAHCGPRAHHELEHCGAVSGLFPPRSASFSLACTCAIANSHFMRSLVVSQPARTSEAHHLVTRRIVLVSSRPTAYPLRRPDLHRDRRAAKHTRHGPLHSGHGYVQRVDIFAGVGPAAVQVPGAGHAIGGSVLDWWVGCACGEGETGLEEVGG
jgi:hypothetical protein